MQQTATVVGTGRMGSALATALFNQGAATTVWNRTLSKTEPLARLELRAAASLEEAVRESGVVILILSNYTIAQQLLQAPGVVAALPGKVLVQLTTGTPQEARHMESWANGLGIAYLDGAIMSYPSGIGQPQCTIFYSGSKEVFDRIRPVLMLLGGNTTYVGSSVGHASALDIAGLSFVLGAMFGFVSGHIVCEEEGISGKAFVESVRNLLPAVEGILAGVSDTIQSRGYAGYEATIDAWSVGPRELIEWCDERGIRHDVASAQQNLFDEAIKRGHGEADFAYLYEIMRKGRTAEPVSA